MKRNLLKAVGLFAILCFLSACKNNPATTSALVSVKKTLNGFAESDAETMISNFESSFDDLNTVQPSKFSPSSSLYTWYSYNEIKEFNDLLTREIDTEKKSIDGIRIYLGTDKNFTGYRPGVTPINYQLFIVTTTPGNGINSHTDDYDHDSPYLGAGAPFGNAIQNNEARGESEGAKLFNTKPTPDNCVNPNDHYVDNQIVFGWVQHRCNNGHQNDSHGYNTRGEWFDVCFIRGLFNAILDSKNKFNGLRIYLGKGFVDQNDPGDGERDVFILYPTQQNSDGGPTMDLDVYQCVQDLGKYFDKCPQRTNANTIPALTENKRTSKSISPSLKRESSILHDEGYNEGELCPTNCN